jgi:hypothetical protein
METVYDWLTVMIFAGLIVLFLQRSTGDAEPRDSIWQYLAASVGCAVANYVGNDKDGNISSAISDTGRHLLAVAIIIGVLAYIYYVLKPFDRTPSE